MSNNDGVPLDEDLLFAENMGRLRAKQKMSRADLVRVLREKGWESVHQTTVTRIEKGEQPVRLREAGMIADALHSTVQSMMQPSFDSDLAEKLFDLRNLLAMNRSEIRDGARAWLQTADEAEWLIRHAEGKGVFPVENSQGAIQARLTAGDELHLVKRELAQPPERSVELARARHEQEKS